MSETEAVLFASRALVGVAARSLASLSDEVTLAQYRVLVLLDGRGPQSMGDLATALDVHPSTVTRFCDSLADKKLISRKSSRDRRSVHADLTAKGRRVVGQAMDRRRQIIDEALQRMPASARRELVRGMAALAYALGEVSDDAWMLGWPVSEGDEGMAVSPGRATT